MTEIDPPDDSKLTRTKRQWASEGRFLTGASRSDGERLPPGQHVVKNWPVLDLGVQPQIDLAHWRLDIAGEVGHPASLDWTAFSGLKQSETVSDIHCVTTWSRYDNRWRGVAVQDLLDFVMPGPNARFVALASYDGYATNMPLEDFAATDSILAHSWEGQPIGREHGGPLRLVVPHLYFWKSPKWLSRIAFLREDRPGFWERNGYHNYGDPWREQRYSEE